MALLNSTPSRLLYAGLAADTEMFVIAAQSATHGPKAWPAFFSGHILGDFIWYMLVSLLIAVSGRFLNAGVFRWIILVCAAGVGVLGVAFIINSFRVPRPVAADEKTGQAV